MVIIFTLAKAGFKTLVKKSQGGPSCQETTRIEEHVQKWTCLVRDMLTLERMGNGVDFFLEKNSCFQSIKKFLCLFS